LIFARLGFDRSDFAHASAACRKPLVAAANVALGIERAGFSKSKSGAASCANCGWELPCFVEQEKTRALNHLSA